MTKPKIAWAIAVLLLFCVAISWFARRGYGEISENAYQLATATYGACLAKNPDRLDRVESLLEKDDFAAGLSDKETRWFRNILAKARQDNWKDAAQAARQMMEDQVKSN